MGVRRGCLGDDTSRTCQGEHSICLQWDSRSCRRQIICWLRSDLCVALDSHRSQSHTTITLATPDSSRLTGVLQSWGIVGGPSLSSLEDTKVGPGKRQTFQKLKNLLCVEPVLRSPDLLRSSFYKQMLLMWVLVLC